MGAVLESFVTIVILAPLLLPVAQQLGVNPLQYGIIMTEAFGIGSHPAADRHRALRRLRDLRRARSSARAGRCSGTCRSCSSGCCSSRSCPWITTVLPTLLNFKG